MSTPEHPPKIVIEPLDELQAFVDLQRAQHFELLGRGIVDRALEAGVITARNLSKINDLTIASVHHTQCIDYRGIKQTAKLCLLTPEFTGAGDYLLPAEAHVVVAHNYPKIPGAVDPQNGFTLDEAGVVIRMIEQRRLAKELGIVPHLNRTLSYLPGSAFTATRPVEEVLRPSTIAIS